MRMTIARWTLALILAGGTTNVAAAQANNTVQGALDAGAKLLGVFDDKTGAWIDRATVRDTLGNQVVTSNIGVALLNGLAPVVGYYLLEIRKEGYAPQHFKLRADSTAEFLVTLEPNALGTATALPAMITTDKRRMLVEDPGLRQGFFARCQVRTVECVGRKDLDLEPTGQIAQLLKKTFGVYSKCTVALVTSLRSFSPSTCGVQMKPTLGPESFCTPTYFLNGFEWSSLAGKSQDQLDQFLNSTVIEGIEVYLSGMPFPGRFMVDPTSHCGLIVIWTR